MNTNDKEIIDRLSNPKTQNVAFGELMRDTKHSLYYHLRTLLYSHEDVDDVLQATYVKIYQNIHSFKGESSLKTWIYRIATNEALLWIRKNARLQQLDSEVYQLDKVNQLSSDPYFDGDQAQIMLFKVIEKLPEKQQLVFKMRYFQDMSYEEIAEITGTSIGALKSSYHIATKKIEDFLQTY